MGRVTENPNMIQGRVHHHTPWSEMSENLRMNGMRNGSSLYKAKYVGTLVGTYHGGTLFGTQTGLPCEFQLGHNRDIIGT